MLLPDRGGWLDDYLEEISTSPSAAHDDYVDSTTQALNYMRGATDGIIEWYRLEADKIAARTASAGAPQIRTVSPGSGPCAGGETVSIGGINLESASVTFGGIPAGVTMATSHTITLISPPGAAGPVDLVVTTPGGSATASRAFTYVAIG